MKYGTLVCGAFNPHFTAVVVDDLFDQSKADAKTAVLIILGAVGLVETFKYLFKVFFFDPIPVVLDADMGLIFRGGFYDHIDLTTCVTEFDGVGEQGIKDQTDLSGVDGDVYGSDGSQDGLLQRRPPRASLG